MKERTIRILIISSILIILFLCVWIWMCKGKDKYEDYTVKTISKDVIKDSEKHETIPEFEKSIDKQNLNPSDQTTDKKDFVKIINRLKKYTESPIQKLDIPVYYINMDKNPDRKEFMEHQLAPFTDRYRRIKGFNGYKIKNKTNDTIDGITFYNYYNDLSNSEIGCVMSHLIAIKTAYDNGDEIALILEDDTVINLINLLDFKFEQLYKEAPQNWEIISLFHMSNSEYDINFLRKNHFNSTKEYEYLQHDNMHYLYSTVGYLINRKGMKKIVDYVYDNLTQSYHIGRNLLLTPNGRADFFIYNIARTYYLQPDLFYPQNLEMQSNIHTEHTDSHIKRSLEVIKYYDDKMKIKDFFKKYDIPAFYINLEKRKDRNESVKNTLSVFPNVERIDAIYEFQNGALGCLKSHIKMLKTALEKYPGKHILFCEDDIVFKENPLLFIDDFFSKELKWDVLVLANYTQESVPTPYKNILRTFNSQTCACYLVRAGYIQTILREFENSLEIYNRLKIWNDIVNCTDQCWKKLQKLDYWYIPEKVIVKQKEDYSDIEKKIVNYYRWD
jgi:GR25 family glycosyltransferase involved in LPS biosynthesis